MSIYLENCEKIADQIRIPFGMVGPVGPRNHELDRIGDYLAGRGNF